ncbi:MAG: ABC transporter permease [Phycisphaerae bacterium]|jgi:putative ABC transport system permease protein|nr:ABC transporter permease [Phycisphaerae bacterium]
MRRIRLVRNIRLGVKNLLLHKMRSMLTVLGLVFGVGSVIAMLAVGEGASQKALDDIRKLGSNNIIISSIKPTNEDGSSSAGGSYVLSYGLTYADEIRIRETMPAVKRTVPVKIIRKKAAYGRMAEQTEMRIVGVSADWFDLVKREKLAGRTLLEHDMEERADVCVLTEHGARTVLSGRRTLGQPVSFGGTSTSTDGMIYEVVGIVRSEHGGEHVPDMRADAYIPISTFIDRYEDIEYRRTAGTRSFTRVELHKILVEVREQSQVKSTADAIRAMLKRCHEQNDYTVHVPLALLEQAESTKRTFNIVLGSIAGISLLVGGIGIMNIMLASVTERTREIGIRRAIGARRSQIVGQFLIETTVLSTVGGLMGIAVGLFFPWLVEYLAGMPTIVPMYSIVLSLGISMGVGILFGIYPAIRAAMLDPIEALRHE